MLKSLSQLAGSKAVLVTVLLGLIHSSQASYRDASGRAHIDLTVKTERGEWSNSNTGRNVRVDLDTFPLDERLLVGEVVLSQGLPVTEIYEAYRPEENNYQCLVLKAGQGLGDLSQAEPLPFRVSRAQSLMGEIRVFCAEIVNR